LKWGRWMNFHLADAIEVIERTPATVHQLLSGLSEGWVTCNEGEHTWNAIEVVGHLIECEKKNWVPRLETFLTRGESGEFPPFDRFSHLDKMEEESLDNLLDEFVNLRKANLLILKSLVNTDTNFEMKSVHPELGAVTLRELLSTWVVHDLTHLSQITRVMAKRYKEDVGPWVKNLSVLK
jgi:hypothetical protein